MRESFEPSPITLLEQHCTTQWPYIRKAAQDASTHIRELASVLSNAKPRLLADARSFVVFGSLARQEWTQGSDLDWTLLIDGYTSADHLRIAQRIAAELQTTSLVNRTPGRTGLFGNLAFSHEIVHQIGGQADSNRNTTQRVLLLLESVAVGDEQGAYNRVVDAVIGRYLGETAHPLSADGSRYRVPRFLLNDIVRFWRTMGVDFATKQRERQGEGWGLRNAKLRLSRKLIFTAGLLTCLSCASVPVSVVPSGNWEEATGVQNLQEHVRERMRLTPLEALAEAFVRYQVPPRSCFRSFDAYDRFLSIMDDDEKRKHLDSLRAEAAPTDSVFREVQEISREFQAGLDALFFDTPDVFAFTRKYGIF